MDLDTLIPLGLAVILLVGGGGMLWIRRYGYRAAGWFVLALFGAVAANYPILEMANARDGEAGVFGALIVGGAALFAAVMLAIGMFLGGSRGTNSPV